MEESFATKHGSELLTDAFEQLLNGCAVTNECGRHLQSTGWDVTYGCLNVVW